MVIKVSGAKPKKRKKRKKGLLARVAKIFTGRKKSGRARRGKSSKSKAGASSD